MKITRRKFLATTSVGVATLYASPLLGNNIPLPANGPDFSGLGKKFRVAVNSDSHVGPQNDMGANMRIFNQMLEEFVDAVNDLDVKADFTVYNGDLVHNPLPASFRNFVRCNRMLKGEKVLVHGNHDGRHPDPQFEQLQRDICGYSGLYYSFDAGDWHFVVLPSRQMLPTTEAEEAYYAWLRADLDRSGERPTMVFHHYHIFPLGTTQLEFYSMSMDMRRTMLDIFKNHGNVQYVIMGHVHNGIKVADKTAFRNGKTAYLMAPTMVFPRPFGEEYPEFLKPGERNCGYWMTLDFDGPNVRFIGRKLQSSETREIYHDIPQWDFEKDPRGFSLIGELDKREQLLNGDFSKGIEGWEAPNRYMRNVDPCYIMKPEVVAGAPAVLLGVKHCGTPWWNNDECVELYQVLDRPAGKKNPVLRANYMVPREGVPSIGGGFIRVSCYKGLDRSHMALFHWGAREYRQRYTVQNFLYADEGHNRGLQFWMRHQASREIALYRLPDLPGKWEELTINIREVFDLSKPNNVSFEDAGIDRLLISFGVWIGNEIGVEASAMFRKFEVVDDESATTLIAGNRPPTDDSPYVPVFGVVDYQGGRRG